MYCWSNSGKRKSLFQNIVIIHFGNRSCCQGMFFLVRFPDFNQKQQICLNFPEIPIKYVQFPSPSRNWILSYAEAVTKCSCFAIQPIANLQDQSILIRHFGETDIQSHIFKKSKNTWYRLNIFEKLYPFLIFWEIQKQDQERMSTGKQPKNSEFEDFPTCLEARWWWGPCPHLTWRLTGKPVLLHQQMVLLKCAFVMFPGINSKRKFKISFGLFHWEHLVRYLSLTQIHFPQCKE